MNRLLVALQSNHTFQQLDSSELEMLLPIISLRTFTKGESVFNFGVTPEYLYYILEGRFTLRFSNNEEKVLQKNDLIGEIGVINADFRMGKVIANEPSEVVAISGKKLFNENIVPPTVALKILKSLSKNITGYLRSKEQVSTSEIINLGETETIEFKSTLRWNLHTNKKDKLIENATLKTILAFINTNGGTLLIGVADDKTVLGLDNDRFKNHDKLLLHITGIIKERIGVLFLKYIHFSIEMINHDDVLRVDCTPSDTPAYLKDGELDSFYIRSGPATTNLRTSLIFDYIIKRFGVGEHRL